MPKLTIELLNDEPEALLELLDVVKRELVGEIARERVTVGWDGASRPIVRFKDELHLPDHARTTPRARASAETLLGHEEYIRSRVVDAIVARTI